MTKTQTRKSVERSRDANTSKPPEAGSISPSIANCRRLASIAHVNGALVKVFGDAAIVWNSGPIVVSKHCVVQPDFAVLKLRDDGYASRLPTADDVLLTVELGGLDLPLARMWKARLFAGAGVPECWILDVVARRMEVHCMPDQKIYRLTRELGSSDSVAPRLLAGCPVRICDLLLSCLS